MIEIKKLTNARDEGCACCTRSQRELRANVTYFAVKLAPSADANRNVVHLCDVCVKKLAAEIINAI